MLKNSKLYVELQGASKKLAELDQQRSGTTDEVLNGERDASSKLHSYVCRTSRLRSEHGGRAEEERVSNDQANDRWSIWSDELRLLQDITST